MAEVGKVLISPLAAAVGAFKKPKKAETSASTPMTPTVNMAAEAARRSALMRRRRGAGANELTGGGAEARSAGGKTLLGQ